LQREHKHGQHARAFVPQLGHPVLVLLAASVRDGCSSARCVCCVCACVCVCVCVCKVQVCARVCVFVWVPRWRWLPGCEQARHADACCAGLRRHSWRTAVQSVTLTRV
jgi:hypothetical protein